MLIPARVRQLVAYLPSRSPASLAKRLVRRADAARDAQQWLAAAALYEEALALDRSRHRAHIQCGHVLKEAGAFDRAEAHYRAARRALPEDADLALQTGHFFKTTGQLEEAEDAYRQALRLQPGWSEPLEELARLRGGGASAPTSSRPGVIVPELLPREHAPAPQRDTIVVRQLGRELVYEGGVRRVLRGVQAIRGWCLASRPIVQLALVIDGEVVRREAPQAYPVAHPIAPGQAKYVFNLWHDFSSCAPGDHEVELRFTDERGQHRVHRAALLVQPQVETPAPIASDAYVPSPPHPGDPVDAWVNGLGSVVRSAHRSVVPEAPDAVLVQRADQLGDLVCSVPALERVRALFPAARLVGLVTPANADLASALGLFDALEVVEFREETGSGRRVLDATAQEALRARLASYRFDIAIDLGEGDASRPLLQLSGARFLYGFRPRDFPWLSAGLEIDARDPLDRLEASAHSRRLLALVEGLAALTKSHARIMPGQAPAPALLARYGLKEGQAYVVLHTGARLPFSRWPGFEKLAELLLQRTDLTILMMRDADEPAIAIASSPRSHVITGRVPFADFDALISGAALFIGNDSGPKHFAALRGVPVVSLHMARLNWNEWGQEMTGVIVSRRIPCAGCGISTRPEECGKDFACIRLIQPEEVFAAAVSQLGRAATDRISAR